MATIRSDLPITHLLGSGDKGGNGNSGFEEQWLHMLEKAHTESQLPAMQCTVTEEDASSVADKESCVLRPHKALPTPEKKSASHDFANRPVLEAVVGRQGKAAVESSILVGSEPGIETKSISQAPGDMPMLHKDSGRSPVSNIARVEKVTHAVRRILPPESVLTIIVAEDGVQVVIRDRSLEQDSAKRLVEKIRHLLDSQKHGVSRIMLNGATVWQSSLNELGGIERGAHRRSQINKLY